MLATDKVHRGIGQALWWPHTPCMVGDGEGGLGQALQNCLHVIHTQCIMRVRADSVVRYKDIILIAVSIEPPALSAITHWVAPELFKSLKVLKACKLILKS